MAAQAMGYVVSTTSALAKRASLGLTAAVVAHLVVVAPTTVLETEFAMMVSANVWTSTTESIAQSLPLIVPTIAVGMASVFPLDKDYLVVMGPFVSVLMAMEELTAPSISQKVLTSAPARTTAQDTEFVLTASASAQTTTLLALAACLIPNAPTVVLDSDSVKTVAVVVLKPSLE